MHCHTAWGQWAVKLLQCTTIPPGGGGQWSSCNARPNQLGGRGDLPKRWSLPKNESPSMHCPTAWGQWAMQLLQYIAIPPGGCGRWNACNARPHQLGGRGVLPRRWSLPKNGSPAMHYPTAWGQWVVQLLQCTAIPPGGSGQRTSRNAWAHQLGGQGVLPRRRSLPQNGTAALHCLTAQGQWAVQLLSCTASLPRGSGQWNCCNALPHCLGDFRS